MWSDIKDEYHKQSEQLKIQNKELQSQNAKFKKNKDLSRPC